MKYETRVKGNAEANDILTDLVRQSNIQVSKLIRIFLKNFHSGKYTAKELTPNCSTSEKRIFRENRQLFEEWGIAGKGYYMFRRCLIQMAKQVLLGYKKRFDYFPFSPPRIRSSDTLFVVKSVIKDLDFGSEEKRGILQIKLPHDRFVDIPYRLSKGSVIKRSFFRSKDFGGNLRREKNCWLYIAAPAVTFAWAYQPSEGNWIAFDFNANGAHFIKLSTGKTIEQPLELRELTRELKQLNLEIKRLNKAIYENKRDKERKQGKQASEKRRLLRAKVDKAHERMEEICRPLAEQIFAEVKAKKALLCIDDLTLKTGSFGHDKVKKFLIEMCEEEKIPFVIVPTPYTSSVHHGCGEFAQKIIVGYYKKGKKAGEPKFSSLKRYCPTHGEFDSHANSSLMIGEWGWFIWENGIDAFSEMKKQKNYQELYAETPAIELVPA